ncbi:MAG: hypothetical protein DUD28_08595 [Lactobacillus sp.]|nr:MAG: hypothetical protein DUD28_08595 [Lactobacillus sp.]
MRRIIIGVTGASGTIYAIDLLQKLAQIPDVETHLVLSQWAKQNLALETDFSLSRIYNVSATPKQLDQKGHEALNL